MLQVKIEIPKTGQYLKLEKPKIVNSFQMNKSTSNAHFILNEDDQAFLSDNVP